MTYFKSSKSNFIEKNISYFQGCILYFVYPWVMMGGDFKAFERVFKRREGKEKRKKGREKVKREGKRKKLIMKKF